MPGLRMGLRPQLRPELSLRPKMSLRLGLRLRLDQRLCLDDHQFGLRLQLLGSIREERYEPKARCPRCSKSLTPHQIISGFRRDPNDFTTKCVNRKCKNRFQPSLICFPSDHTSIELPFFCGAQTLGQMRGRDLHTLSPHEIARREPAIYRAAIIHHGTLRKAFEEIGYQYPFVEIPEWRTKVLPFLGKMPDDEIAKCAGVAKEEIAVLRSELEVKKYTKSKGLLNAERAAKAEEKKAKALEESRSASQPAELPKVAPLVMQVQPVSHTNLHAKLVGMAEEYTRAKAMLDDPLYARAAEVAGSASHLAAFEAWNRIEKILAP